MFRVKPNRKFYKKQSMLLLSAFILAAVFLAGCQKASSGEDAQEESTKKETNQPETAQKETAQPEDVQSETTQPDIAQSEIKTQEALKKIEYSNLTDKETQEMLREYLKEAGVGEERINNFFGHVEHFNKSVPGKFLTKGFESADVLDTKYDPYEMQDEWMEHNPDFEGYNCRITALELFGDFVTAENPLKKRDKEYLSIDFMALEEDSSALAGDKDMDVFNTLFSTVFTENSKDIGRHVKKIQKAWEERGIQFADNKKIRLISVLFHDQLSADENILYVGHAGILLPLSDEEIYFVEKLAFQEPYRLLKFRNRIELSDYLMEKYDLSWDQPTASPFILENDCLMDGYRKNPNNQSLEE